MQDKIMKIEYDTTNIDIDSLCTKYGVVKNSLEWYTPPSAAPTLQVDPIILDINNFKEDAVKWAKGKLADDQIALELSTKEVRDLVSIIDTIGTSLTKANQSDAPVQVNVLVQNLMAAADDC